MASEGQLVGQKEVQLLLVNGKKLSIADILTIHQSIPKAHNELSIKGRSSE